MTERSGTGSASFRRGLNVLIAVTEFGEITAEQLAAELEVPLSTVYRYLRTLRELDLIEERDRTYVPGWRLLELSGQDVARTRLVELGHGLLRSLTDVTGETAVLTVRVGTWALCLRQVESHHAMRMAFRIGQLLPLYAGAGQRTLLAYAPPAVVERVLAQPRSPGTGRAPTRATMLRELEEIRRTGYLVSHGELSEGAIAVAVPVFAGGEVVCSLTVAGPDTRCGPRWTSRARSSLARAAKELAETLDHA